MNGLGGGGFAARVERQVVGKAVHAELGLESPPSPRHSTRRAGCRNVAQFSGIGATILPSTTNATRSHSSSAVAMSCVVKDRAAALRSDDVHDLAGVHRGSARGGLVEEQLGSLISDRSRRSAASACRGVLARTRV